MRLEGLQPFKELFWRASQGPSQGNNRLEGRVSLSSFDHTDEARMKPCSMGQFFLTPICIFAVLVDRRSERLDKGVLLFP